MRSSLAAAAPLVGLASLLWGAASHAQQAAPSQPAPAGGVQLAAQTGQTPPPRCDANCVRANAGKAADACAPRIEAQAPSDFEWLTRPTPGIFQQADPSSPSDSIVRFRGDSIRFLAADKSWMRVSYECGYDVATQSVDFVHVRSGRLDQPLATQPATAAPAPAATAALVRPASGVATHASPVVPTPPATAAAHPRPHVGEPSPIEIQQEAANPKPH
jgi:hypothetical protein